MVRVFSAPRLFQSPPRLSESAPVTLAVKFEASLVVAAFLDRVGNLESAPSLWRHRSTSRSADGRGYFLASAKTRQWPSSLFGRFFFSRETPPRAESQGSRNSARRRDPGGSDPPSSRDTAPFPPRAVLPRMDVGKILSRGGVTTVDFSRGGPTVTKFHCTNSKLREKRFSAKKWSGKYQISKPKGRPRPPLQPLSDVHVSAAVFYGKHRKNATKKSMINCFSISAALQKSLASFRLPAVGDLLHCNFRRCFAHPWKRSQFRKRCPAAFLTRAYKSLLLFYFVCFSFVSFVQQNAPLLGVVGFWTDCRRRRETQPRAVGLFFSNLNRLAPPRRLC